MKKQILILSLIAGSILAGVPVAWDVRFGDSSVNSKSAPFGIEAMNGETTDLMPRYFDRGRAITLESNAFVRAYFREYGTTNSFVASSATGTVYTTASDKGRVKITTLTSDYAALTNEFFIGCENSGMMYRAYGKLIVLDSVGTIATTNSNERVTIDWSATDNINTDDAPFLTEVTGYVSTNASITATLISNKTYSIIFTNP